jgi:hypothetical protein
MLDSSSGDSWLGESKDPALLMLAWLIVKQTGNKIMLD